MKKIESHWNDLFRKGEHLRDYLQNSYIKYGLKECIYIYICINRYKGGRERVH